MNTANPFVARPATYYGDGPFDPPSSDDDGEEAEGSRHSFEDDAESVLLLNIDKSGPSSPGTAERGDQNPHVTDAKEKVRPFNAVHGGILFLTLYSYVSIDLQKYSSVRILALALISLVALSAFIGIIAGFTYTGKSYYTPGSRKITMDALFNGTFYASGAEVNWVPEGMCGEIIKACKIEYIF